MSLTSSMKVNLLSFINESSFKCIITLKLTLISKFDYAFRNYYYITTKIQLFTTKSVYNFCIDFDCVINLIDCAFLSQVINDAAIKQMSTFMIMQEISNKKHNVRKYVIIKMYFFFRKESCLH